MVCHLECPDIEIDSFGKRVDDLWGEIYARTVGKNK
jgi:hypothetical protein